MALLAPLRTQADAGAEPLQTHAQAIADTLDARAQAALERMPDARRRLLALRAYVRAGKHFGDRWSWTQAQIEAYEQSAQKRAALDALERVRSRFADMNPGYTLQVNTQVRSLDLQLARWNENPGVLRTAAQLHRTAQRELDGRYPAIPTDASTARFSRFLQAWTPSTAAPLAAPGLSRHGQARAFDFHILRGDAVVASTEMAAVQPVWERQGWTERLKAAVQAASDDFVGPLPVPYEPWHYEYNPAAALAASGGAGQ